MFGSSLESHMASASSPVAAELLWSQMSRDIMGGGGAYTDSVQQVREFDGVMS